MTQYGEEDPDKDTNANLVKYVPDELKVVRLEKAIFIYRLLQVIILLLFR